LRVLVQVSPCKVPSSSSAVAAVPVSRILVCLAGSPRRWSFCQAQIKGLWHSLWLECQE